MTSSAVVFATRKKVLDQYRPTSEQMRETPPLLISPGTNAVNTHDLRELNNLIKWITDQVHTLFVASRVNPGPSQADVQREDCIKDACLGSGCEAKSI